MKRIPSIQIKIAAFFFLVGGIMSFVPAVVNLITQEGSESLGGLIYFLVQIVIIILSLLNILVGLYLIKLRRWSYVLGFILLVISLILHIYLLIQFGSTGYYKIALTSVLLILLIAARKDFKQN